MAGSQHIGSSQLVRKTVKMAFVVSAGTLTNDNRFWSMRFDDSIKFFSDCIQGLIPGDPFPALGGFAQGMQDSIRMIRQLSHRQSLAAQRPTADRRLRIALDLDDFTVLHMGNYTTSPMTLTAGRPYFFDITHILPPYFFRIFCLVSSFSANSARPPWPNFLIFTPPESLGKSSKIQSSSGSLCGAI